MRRAFAGLCVVVFVAGLVSAQPRERDRPVKGAKDAPQVKATVVRIDAAKRVLVVKMDGKTVDLPVSKEVKFIGPRGGVATAGIKDRRLTPGVVLSLVMDGKTVREVHIPVIRRLKDKGKIPPPPPPPAPAGGKGTDR